MAAKNTTFTLSQNQTSSEVTSHATVSGRTVYGRIVSATETIKQEEYVNPDSAYVNIGTLTLTACTNQSIYTVSGVNFSYFQVQDNSCGSTITSAGLNIGNMETMQDTDETELPWVGGEHVINTLRGDNLTGRLYFYANGGDNDIYIETSVWINMSTECRGWFNDDLSSGNLWVFDYDLGEVASAGNVNFGNLDIGIYINGGDGDITLTYTGGYVENSGGTKEVQVRWHDMMPSGITISVTGNATVLTWGPNSFSGSNGSGTIRINFGENGGPSSGSYVTTVAASGKTVLGTNKNKTVDIYQHGGYEPDTPPPGEAWLKFTEAPIYFLNNCDDKVYCEGCDVRISVGNDSYFLEYRVDGGEELVWPGDTTQMVLSNVPSKIIKTSSIYPTITYAKLYVTDKNHEVFGLRGDEVATLSGPDAVGGDFEISISAVEAGHIEYNTSHGIGTVHLGEQGLVFDDEDEDVTFSVEHYFNGN
jgi:hypothetical protein